MKMRSVVPMRIAKIGYIIMSLLFCAAGIFFIAMPETSEKAIGVCVGTSMLVFGSVKLVGYFSKDLFRLAFQFDLELGIALIILGAAVLFRPGSFMTFICAALGMAILLDGLFKIRIAADSKRFGIETWWLILAAAILTVVAGAALVLDSVAGARVLTVLIGVSLLFEGVSSLCTVISTVRIIKNQLPDAAEAYMFESDLDGRPLK